MAHPEMARCRPQSTVDLSTLSPFQRILLVTDGTVTDILQAYVEEKLSVVKLLQRLDESQSGVPDLDVPPLVRVLVRHILLRGVRSQKNYLYAESILVPDRLDRELRAGLFATEKPLGQLIVEAQLETRREILRSGMERAGVLGKFFAVHGRTSMITRTYRVFIAQRAVMLITEKFPRSLFRGRS